LQRDRQKPEEQIARKPKKQATQEGSTRRWKRAIQVALNNGYGLQNILMM